MLVWLIGRPAQCPGVMFLMTVLVLIRGNIIGDPTAVVVSLKASAENRARILAAFNLQLSLSERYLIFLRSAAHGNLGNSFVYNDVRPSHMRSWTQRFKSIGEDGSSAVVFQ
ncbi:MAG TPA: hypothetical protein VHB49_15530 [Bradyrhizobium sp.]|nr:hypothetical protein [Bradyrhizobium sp.]